jgi:uncharacterized protein (DUF849 family)
MSRLAVLPAVMVAPNGARLGKAEHPALPVTIAEIVATARACHTAGAGAINAHLRDAEAAWCAAPLHDKSQNPRCWIMQTASISTTLLS